MARHLVPGRLAVLLVASIIAWSGTIGGPPPARAVEPSAPPTVTPTPVRTPGLEPVADVPGLEPLPAGAFELVEQRTESSRTYVNADGRLTAELYTEPIFYRPAGSDEYVPVEVGFRASTDAGAGAVSDRAPTSVAVAASTADGGFLVLARDGQQIAFGLPAAVARDARTVEPTVAGAVADYAGLLPGVDLRVIAGARGAKSFFVWHAEPADPTLSYVVNAPGLVLVPTPDGAIELRDAKGEAVARIPAPYAVDSTRDERAGSGRFTDKVKLALASDGRTVTVSVDPIWLATAAYPVYVDPSTGWVFNAGTNSYGDAHTASGYPTFNFDDYVRPDSPYYHELWNGTDPSGTSGTSYDFLRWNLSALQGSTVDSATLALVPYHQYYNAPTQETTYVRRVTGSWTENGITWNTMPNYTTTYTATEGCVEGNWCTWDVADIVQLWLRSDSPSTNYGFQVDTIGKGSTYWKRFIASEQGGTHRPKLTVTYHKPAVETTTSDTVFTSDPAVTWVVEPDIQTAFEVEVATDPSFGAGTIVASSDVVADDVALMWEIPDSVTLVDDTSYAWRVRVKDGFSWSDWAVGTLNHDVDAGVLGITPDGSPRPEEDGGYSPADVALKEAAFAAFLAAEESGSWAPSGICPQAPGADCGSPPPPPPVARSLDITLYYQQRTYFCVPAVIQSILHYLVGGLNYVGDGSEAGVTRWQSKIYAKVITDKEDEQPGSDDAGKGLRYINERLAGHGWNLRYLPKRSSTVSQFRSRIKMDIWRWAMPMYVRVKYASSSWPGHHADPPGQEILHATAAVGYHSSGASVYVYNPIAKTVAGVCSVPAYDRTNRFACAHDLAIQDYWLSRDPNEANGAPEWY